MRDLVEIGALREYVVAAVARGDVTWAAVATHIGYTRDQPDSGRVALALGLRPSRNGGYYAKTMNPTRWRTYAEAIHSLGGPLALPVPGRRGQPSVDPLVAAKRAAGVSCWTLAKRLGFVRSQGDTSRLQRALGARSGQRGKATGGRQFVNHRLSYSRAEAIMRFVGAQPYEVEL